ncbi:lipid storage droplets surface-binding protein 1 isoform X4 [Dendroctonus ponderosae]|uniref:lipid storage droplets surface-binding protein 1 isoform X4 n=1 Tax=Dendroctonus ponderosae TaxID=77166 RepID=UPI002034D5A7|nr:lipid storage droplets surface-binding protein 1 isoform X4 [Dendroctonus ponderosae]
MVVTYNILKVVQSKRRTLNMPELESVTRIFNLPIVETGLSYAENIYQRIKKSNSLFTWTFDQAENTLYSVIDSAGPAIYLIQGPLSQVDKIVCKTLDIVEEKVPSINLPPEMIYWNTKQYAKEKVNKRIVTPVLKRADSVKQVGNSVLESKYTVFAADTLDGALTVADKYVDKYLPPDDQDKGSVNVLNTINNNKLNIIKLSAKYYKRDAKNCLFIVHFCPEVNQPSGKGGKAIHTIQHVDRLGRKLKRRLTRRTIAEVKALKEHSAEAVHVLIYVAELVATDPVMAFQKGKELWTSLSKDEPENQARPENVEQLIVLLTRESARRMVHLVNFTTSVAKKVNRNVTRSVAVLVHKFIGVADSVVKTAHLEQVQQATTSVIRTHAYSVTLLLKQLNTQLTNILDNWAKQLAIPTEDNTEEPKPEILEKLHQTQTVLPVPQIKFQQIKSFHVNAIKNKNGFEYTMAENLNKDY